jgi:hypothetical protein
MALYAFDGTWNEPHSGNPEKFDTNVVRFIDCLESREQLGLLGMLSEDAEYVNGVGTRFGLLGKLIGGFTGAGGRERIREFLRKFQENWRQNDRTVEIIGFSRGAALALHFCNALNDGVEVDGVKVVPTIRFLGLWDTVPAFGLPGVLIDAFQNWNIGWQLNVPANVAYCYHAMALDESRQAFQVHRPRLLDPAQSRLTEVWFRGTHGGVGGGDKDRSLSSIALYWMLEQAANHGIAIDPQKMATVAQESNQQVSAGKSMFSGDIERRKPRPGDTFHHTAATPLDLGKSRQVTVNPREKFNISDILVDPQCAYTIQFDSQATWVDLSIICTAAGWPDKLPDNKPGILDNVNWAVLNSYVFSNFKRVKNANWFELVACVNYDLDTAVAAGQGQYGEANFPWHPQEFGRLSLFANDAESKYDNNKGTLLVTITRVL